jgi:hypothetical protein
MEAHAQRKAQPTIISDCIEDDAASAHVPALLHCARVFGLSAFEGELLLLLAGLELDERLRTAVAALNGGSSSASFALALGHLTQPHWDGVGPEAPLRYWRMIQMDEGRPIMYAPLRIDERILHFITGVPASEPPLFGIALTRVTAQRDSGLVDHALVDAVTHALAQVGEAGPIVVLQADGGAARARDLAVAVARESAGALWINAALLPGNPAEVAEIARRLDREVALTNAMPVLSAEVAGSEGAAVSCAEQLRSALLWIGPHDSLSPLSGARAIIRFHVPRMETRRTVAALTARWHEVAATNGDVETAAALERAATQFQLDAGAIDDIVARVATLGAGERPRAVWSAAREAARGGLDALAQRIITSATLDDLVLPAPQLAALRDITRHLRHRDRVYQDWGFGEKHSRGQGITALFIGESGTGKTLAAEAIANHVELDLYRVDLATVVSKYIGETEKNLKRVFDAAEASGAVLLFDEADALFGKRSEVKDSHDRYANIEIAYLLQRVEAFRGLAILTTNMKSAVDRAFLRRIRFVVHFPFPDATARKQIWHRQFPPRAPLGDVDFGALARLNLAGGNINSIAINAAFSAADADAPIDNTVLLAAVRAEFAKLERSFNGALSGDGA